jgi:hypothetical protein
MVWIGINSAGYSNKQRLDVSVVPDPPNEVVITVGIETATNLN